MDLREVELRQLPTREVTLEGADLRGASLWRAEFVGAKLSRARLDDANCSSTDLSNADLDTKWPRYAAEHRSRLSPKGRGLVRALGFAACSANSPRRGAPKRRGAARRAGASGDRRSLALSRPSGVRATACPPPRRRYRARASGSPRLPLVALRRLAPPFSARPSIDKAAPFSTNACACLDDASRIMRT